MKEKAIVLSVLTTLVASASAGFTFQEIDFGADHRDPAEGIIVLDHSFDAHFASLGVYFSSPTDNPIYWIGTDYGFTAGAGSLNMGNPTQGGISNYPLRVDFLTPVAFASIHGVDGGGDIDTLAVRAYSYEHGLVDQNSLTSSFGGLGGTVGVEAPSIDYILIQQTGSSAGLFLDDLRYIQVPTPATLPVLGLALFARRRR
ncbi:MAG: hypothetical protein JJ974_10170 [Phycisphaerales bacterium]|nr:hypothetical protein [Phycisphaerales bacterium]